MTKNDKQTTFLIVTPSFNQAQFIKQTIDSVLTQGLKVRYLIADGKSDDETVQILKKYGKQISWFSKKDKGQTDAINQGIAFFKQDHTLTKSNVIFAYLNSDDYYLPEALITVASLFNHNPKIMWLVGDARIVNEKNQNIQTGVRFYKSFLRKFYHPELLKILNPIPQPATFIRWQAVKKVGLFNTDLKYVMDYEYWLRLQSEFGPPHFLTDQLAAFRIHKQSKGGTQYIQQFAEQYQVASMYTTHALTLMLHHLHNWLTIKIYQFIK